MRWQYTIPEDLAFEFREAAENDNYYDICDTFIAVCSWIQANVPDAEYEMEDLLDEAEFWDVDDPYFEEDMNYCLDELYDICDAYGIWIPV